MRNDFHTRRKIMDRCIRSRRYHRNHLRTVVNSSISQGILQMPIASCFVSFARLASRAAAARSARVSRVRIERVLTSRVKRFQLRPAAPNGTRSSSPASFFDDRLGGFRVRENLSRSRSADLLACNDSPRARARCSPLVFSRVQRRFRGSDDEQKPLSSRSSR